MEDAKPNLFTRDDTLFGVCQGIAEDCGFNPLWLRLALTPVLFVSPIGAVGAYAAAGLVVLASRLLFPDPRPAPAAAAAARPEPLVAANETGPEPMSRAA